MRTDRRTRPAAIPFASLWPFLVICMYLGIAALGYISLKNRLHSNGDQIKRLESELAALTTGNQVLKSRALHLASRREIQRQIDSGFVEMIPITNDRIVWLGPAAPNPDGDLRTVANREAPR